MNYESSLVFSVPTTSMSSLMKRKIGVVARMSNTFGLLSKRESGTIIINTHVFFLNYLNVLTTNNFC